MKTSKLLIIGFLGMTGLFFSACGGEKKTTDENEPTGTEETAVESKTYNINTGASVVQWKGTMVGADLLELYSHSGDVKFNSGTLVLAGDQVKSGTFSIDMTSIVPTDDNYSEENPASKLVGHLQSEDFFHTAEFPTATFTIESAEGNTAKGTLTVRGKSGTEEVKNITVTEMGNHLKITGDITFNRQKYDVKFSMNASDKIVSDDIKLNIEIMTEPQ